MCTLNCSDCFSGITRDFKQSCEIPKGIEYKDKKDNYRDFFLPTFKSQVNEDIKGMLQEVICSLFKKKRNKKLLFCLKVYSYFLFFIA